MASIGTLSVFVRSWELFVRNLILVVPGFLAGGVSAFVAILVEPANAASPDVQLGSDVASRTLALLVQVIASVLSIAFTTGMADAAWRGGRATFADGRRAFAREGGQLFVALLALFVLGLVASALAPYTLALSLATYAYFCLYTLPAVVVGERRGLIAVVESARIAFGRPLTTIAILAAIFGIAYVSGIGAFYVAATPYVGSILSSLLVQAVVAFATLVIVGEYRTVRHMEGIA